MISKFGSKLRTGLVVAVLILAGVLYAGNATVVKFGVVHDDSIFVTAAKSLATGQGYRYIGLPFDPAQTKYPILYPLLLSTIWRMFPEFPANVIPMMGLSILLGLVFLLLSYLYLVDRNYARPGQALLILFLVAANPIFEIVSSSVLSDVPYAALSLAALWLVERVPTGQKVTQRKVWWLTLSAGITLGLAYLTRSIAITLLLSVVAYLVIKREFKKALVIAATAGCFIAPWLLWCRMQAAGISSGEVLHYYFDYVSFYHKAAGELGIANIVTKNMAYLSHYVPMLCLAYVGYGDLPTLSKIFVSLTLIALAAGLARHVRTELRVVHLYVLAYIVVLLFWPFPMFERLLVPILPLLLLYLTTEFIRIFDLAKSAGFNVKDKAEGPKAAATSVNKILAIFFLLTLSVWPAVIGYNSLSTNLRIRSSKAFYAEQAEREQKAFKWIRKHTSPHDVLFCNRDQVYYLFTGRKTVGFVVFLPAIIKDIYTNQAQYPLHQEEYFFNVIRECKVQYLITDPEDFSALPLGEVFREKLRETIAKRPQRFLPVYRDAANMIIYRINTE